MSTPLRITWLVKGLGPGGAERLLVAAAGSHDREHFAFEVVYLLPWKNHLVAELEARGVPCTCLEVSDERDVRWAGRLRRHLREHRTDVLHSHSPYAAAVGRVVARSLPKSRRPILVSTEHNPWTTFKRPTRYANAVTARLDDAIFAVSDEARASMSRRQRDRAEVLVHGIDLAGVVALRTERDAVRTELEVEPGAILIGTVANYHPKKDWPNLLHAVRRLADRDPSVRVCAVGQGPLAAEVEALYRELELEQVVTLTGYRADAVRLMAGCDIFVLASKYEGLPVALMEACALGLPIVATSVGGIPDVFRDGIDAVLVRPGDPDALADALAAVAHDDRRRADLAAAAECKAADFDIARAVTRLEDVYRELAAR